MNNFYPRFASFAALLFLLNSVQAQNSWTQVASSPSSNTNTCIDFPSDSIGYLVNFSGRFCKSTDGGITWQNEQVISPNYLYGVDFANDTVGYAVGKSGSIYKTINGGSSWSLQSTPISDDLFDVHVLNNDTAFAVGRYRSILRTTNGGTTWVKYSGASSSNASTFLKAVKFRNNLLGIAVGVNNGLDGDIYRTTDGGATWTYSSKQWDILTDIHFTNDSTCYLLGHTINTFPTTRLNIYKSDDYGLTWVKIFEDYPGYIEVMTNQPPNRSAFNSDSTLYMSGTNGMVMKLNFVDSVLTLMSQDIGSVDFKDIVFKDDQRGLVIGEAGTIFGTTDGGLTWAQENNGIGASIRAIQAVDSTQVHAHGNGSARIKTNNGGDFWNIKSYSLNNYKDLDFVDEMHGYTVTSVGSNSTFQRSDDGGQSWTYQTISGSAFNTLDFIDTITGYLAGNGGVISKSVDGGASWTGITSPTTEHIRGCYALSTDTVYFVGDNGLIISTYDGGSNWNTYSSGVSSILFDVYFWDAQTGYVGGQSRTFLKTTDGGATWNDRSPSSGSDIISMYFMDDSTGYVAGGNSGISSSGASSAGFVHKTTDGGTTWDLLQLSLTIGLNTIDFSPTGEGFVGGSNGYVAKTYDLSIIELTHSDIQCTGLSTGSSSVGAFNGTPPYSYSWSPSVSTDSIATNLSEGIYIVTVTDVLGYSIKKKINIGPSTSYNYTSETIQACDSYDWNGTVYSASGTYLDTIVDISGCDTIKTLYLSLNSSSSFSEIASSCDSYTWSTNGATYTSSGSYQTVLVNSVGCDSSITLDLTINNGTSFSETITACDSYQWSTNGTTYASSGIYTEILTAANGCDSVVTLDLTINAADTSVSLSGISLMANAVAAGYQWLDCDNSSALINGENAQSFTPSQNGNYSVEITQNGCIDTSSCYLISSIEVKQIPFGEGITGFPNPTSETVFIDLGQLYEKIEFSLKDITGKTLKVVQLKNVASFSFNIDQPDGVYLLEVDPQTNEKGIVRIVKN